MYQAMYHAFEALTRLLLYKLLVVTSDFECNLVLTHSNFFHSSTRPKIQLTQPTMVDDRLSYVVSELIL